MDGGTAAIIALLIAIAFQAASSTGLAVGLRGAVSSGCLTPLLKGMPTLVSESTGLPAGLPAGLMIVVATVDVAVLGMLSMCECAAYVRAVHARQHLAKFSSFLD